ncbi:MAG: hypothetical protein IT337_16925 [Thermomicrobiales bacterium]|nr:hypothetical protein [Thermomicrobiales bacterium]
MMVPVRLLCDVVGRNRVRFYRDIELPSAPFPNLYIGDREAGWAMTVHMVWWSVGDARYEAYARDKKANDEASERAAHAELTTQGWKMFGLGIGQ